MPFLFQALLRRLPHALATALYVLYVVCASLLFIALIAVDTYVLPRVCFLRFPRDPEELLQPHFRPWLTRVLQQSGHVAARRVVAVRRLDARLVAEPDKNKTAAGFQIEIELEPGARPATSDGNHASSASGAASGDAASSCETHLVFVKWNCGRGFPLWLQGVRAAVECGIAREADFYSRIAAPLPSHFRGGRGADASAAGGRGALPIRTPVCMHADSMPWINRVVLVLEHLDVRADPSAPAPRASAVGGGCDEDAESRSEKCDVDVNDGGSGRAATISTPVAADQRAGQRIVYQRADHQGCPVAAARAALGAIARLHGMFIGVGRAHADARTAWLPPRGGLQFYNFIYEHVKKEVEKDSANAWLGDLWQALNDYFTHSAAATSTLVHGDCRVGNMWFSAPLGGLSAGNAAKDSDTVIFSDWEAVNVAPCLWDVTYLTTLSLKPEQRVQHLDELLRHYLDALRRAVASGATRSKRSAAAAAAVPSLGEARLQVSLLTLVLYYMSSMVVKEKVWDGHGNTALDSNAWQARIAAAVAKMDASVVASALGVKTALLHKLQQRCANTDIEQE